MPETPTVIHAHPPDTLTGEIRVHTPPTSAAGLPAVANALRHVFSQTRPLDGARALAQLNQKGGFDCPSCAWPDPDTHRSTFEFCENGAKAVASETTSARATPEFFATHSVAWLSAQSDLWLDRAGRLTHPMVLHPGATHYSPISWPEAMHLLADELHALPTPDHAVFYTSGRASNEAAFLYQLFVRQFGTNNLPDCSNMCHESSGVAMQQTVGVGKGTVTLQDIEEAETILLVGQNPGTNHPRMLSTLELAVRQGAQLIAVNPLQEAGLTGFMHPQHLSGMLGRATPLAQEFLAIRPNGDHALFLGLAKSLIEENLVDHEFIQSHTTGFDDYAAHIRRQEWSELEASCGLPRTRIEAVARQCASGHRRLITCWAMGLTQHRNAVATIREVAHLHLLLGAIGRPGAGLCPVRGHSNVQGNRTVGIYEKMSEPFMAALEREFSFTAPRRHGYDTVQSIAAMLDGKVGVFFALGGNFLQAAPDTASTATALQKCRLTAHVSTKLNRSHLITGRTGLILPCLGRSEIDRQASGEQFVTVENSMSVVHSSHGVLEPASPHLRSETAIVAALAQATLGPQNPTPWASLCDDYRRIRQKIADVVPDFDGYELKVSQPGGFYLRNDARERAWKTKSGKATFYPASLEAITLLPGQLLLQTLRSHDQFNTTIYGLNDRYRGISGERRIVFMAPSELKARHLRPLQPVDITSHWQGEQRSVHRFLAVPYTMPEGAAAAYYPEANPLIPLHSVAHESGTPTSKGVIVTIAASPM
jgi:molybdopterin-dependent oxidoreductase alpha subunit